MKTTPKMRIAAGMIVIASMLAAKASAQCGGLGKPSSGRSLQPQSWQLQNAERGTLVLASENESDDSIVGFWKVTFIAKGNSAIPDGTVIDKAFAQWHSDGTEIMNSSRPPVTSSFCLGVWKKVGHNYNLNHFAISWDANNNTSPVGPANIREVVQLSHDGEAFAGTFTIDQYDQSGNTLLHVQGQITGTRIHVDTTVSSVL